MSKDTIRKTPADRWGATTHAKSHTPDGVSCTKVVFDPDVVVAEHGTGDGDEIANPCTAIRFAAIDFLCDLLTQQVVDDEHMQDVIIDAEIVVVRFDDNHIFIVLMVGLEPHGDYVFSLDVDESRFAYRWFDCDMFEHTTTELDIRKVGNSLRWRNPAHDTGG